MLAAQAFKLFVCCLSAEGNRKIDRWRCWCCSHIENKLDLRVNEK